MKLPRFLLAASLLAAPPLLAEPPSGRITPVAPQAVPKETATAATCAALTAGPLKVSSDPEEGGQVAARKSTGTKPKVGDLTVTNKMDTASTKMMGSAPSPGTSPGTCAAPQH